MAFAAYLPPWIAPCAMPGHAFDRRHVADDEHVRVTGNGQIGQHLDPAGAVDLDVGLLGEVAAQRAGRHTGRPDLGSHSMRRVVPSESLTVMPLRSTSVTMAPSWISTPIFSSRACAFLPSFSPIGARTAGKASSRITRAVVESICRYAPLSVWSASSAICPAISTPVGPAPTTVNVNSFSRRAGSLDRSACSNAPRMRARNSSASSIDFMPGANSAKWSLPKYDWPAPAAMIRLSKGVT